MRTNRIITALLITLTLTLPAYLPLVGGNVYVTYLCQFLLIAIIMGLWRNNHSQPQDKWLKFYFIWVALCILRGFFVAENYMEYKQLWLGSVGLLVPLFLVLFNDPMRFATIYKPWCVSLFILMPFQLCAFPLVSQHYYSPLLILVFFFPFLNTRLKKWLVIFFVLAFILTGIDSRSQMLKGLLCLFAGLFIKYRKTLSIKIIKKIHIAGYLSVFLIFGYFLTDAYGVISGKITVEDAQMNNAGQDHMHFDTRSLLLVDVLNSSIDNGYWIYGNTPARGFEFSASAVLFYDLYDDDAVFNKGERFKNEMGLTNIYTWTGIIGLFLYSMLYFRSTYLAIYKSRNRYVKYLACLVAFYWAYGWIEFPTNFGSLDISLWAMIAICYSEKFRYMTDAEFENWIPSLLGNSKHKIIDIYD